MECGSIVFPSRPYKDFLSFVADADPKAKRVNIVVYGILGFAKVDPDTDYPTEVKANYFKEIVGSKKYNKQATILHVNPDEAEHSGIRKVILITVNRQKFSEPTELSNPYFTLVKIAFNQGRESRYFEPSKSMRLFDPKCDDLEIQESHCLISPLSLSFWDIAPETCFEALEELCKDVLAQMKGLREKPVILEICGGKGALAKKL